MLDAYVPAGEQVGSAYPKEQSHERRPEADEHGEKERFSAWGAVPRPSAAAARTKAANARNRAARRGL